MEKSPANAFVMPLLGPPVTSTTAMNAPAPSDVTLIPVQSPGVSGVPRRGWAAQASLGLGITQIILGLILIIGQIILFVENSGVRITCHGFICGVLYITAGSFGIAAAKHGTNCMITTVMVLTIICAASTTLIVIFSTVGLMIEPLHISWRDSSWDGLCHLLMSVHGIMLGVSLVNMVLAIISSSLACRFMCCNTQGENYMVAYAVAQPGPSNLSSGNLSGQLPPRDVYPTMTTELYGAGKPPSYTSLDLQEPMNEKAREAMAQRESLIA